MISGLIMIAVAFVVGGVPTGYWVAKVLKGIDIREHGSGSTGATNVWRVVGKGPGVFTFAVDVLKGVIPVMVARYLNDNSEAVAWTGPIPYIVPTLAAVAVLVGHSKSVFLGFKGGKSAATGLGALIALCPPGGGMTFVTWLVVLFTSGYVSLASILGVFSCPFWFYLFHAPVPYVVYCVFGFIYVTYRHKSNVQRLLNGTEPKFGKKMDQKTDNDSGKTDEASEKSNAGAGKGEDK